MQTRIAAGAGSPIGCAAARRESRAAAKSRRRDASAHRFMNTAHFEQLKNANMLSDDLARRIEARPLARASQPPPRHPLAALPPLRSRSQAFREVASN